MHPRSFNGADRRADQARHRRITDRLSSRYSIGSKYKALIYAFVVHGKGQRRRASEIVCCRGLSDTRTTSLTIHVIIIPHYRDAKCILCVCMSLSLIANNVATKRARYN